MDAGDAVEDAVEDVDDVDLHGDADAVDGEHGEGALDGEQHMIVETRSEGALQRPRSDSEELGTYRTQIVLDTRQSFPSDPEQTAASLRACEEP